MRYDRNRHSLDRHATYAIARYIAGSEWKIGAYPGWAGALDVDIMR
jgi:hypothetical protein